MQPEQAKNIVLYMVFQGGGKLSWRPGRFNDRVGLGKASDVRRWTGQASDPGPGVEGIQGTGACLSETAWTLQSLRSPCFF